MMPGHHAVGQNSVKSEQWIATQIITIAIQNWFCIAKNCYAFFPQHFGPCAYMDTFLLQFPYLPTVLLQFLHLIYFLQFSSVHQHFLLFYFFGHLCCWLLLMCHSFLQSYSSSYITYISYSSVHFISILFLYLYFFSPPPFFVCYFTFLSIYVGLWGSESTERLWSYYFIPYKI